jgi:F-type H+-transporting ATPase subunit b
LAARLTGNVAARTEAVEQASRGGWIKMKKTIASMVATAAAMLPAAAHAAEGGGEDHGSWMLFAFFVINFILFVYVIVRFAGPAIGSYFRSRATEIRGALSRAEKAFAEAQDLANQAAERAAGLEAEVAALIRDIDEETRLRLKRLAELAEATVERLRRDAEMTSAAITEGAERRLRAELAAVSARLARDLIQRSFEASDQNRLLESFMGRLEGEA